MNTIIDPVRGMRDVLPTIHREQVRVQSWLHTILARYGYQCIDLPIIEHRDLYRRKMGESLVGKVYEFHYGGRELALRPEWTASVLRAYISHMQQSPLPLRLCYSGPVFRYQPPQHLTTRQFTQVGVELIGGPAPQADAEVVALACDGLEYVGITDYQVRIAHIGIVKEILMHLQLTERTQGLLIWSLEEMRERGVDAIRQNLEKLIGDLPIEPTILADLNDEQVKALLTGMLQEIGVNLSFGTRPPEEIVDRLIRKMRRYDPEPRIEKALSVLWQLSQIQGEPDVALAELSKLLEEHSIEAPSLQELQKIVSLLQAHGVSQQHILLDSGMGRGLHYYTGLIFEIYNSDNIQLCGGGRYDDLVHILGCDQSVPAAGFAYELERVVAACTSIEDSSSELQTVLVAAKTADDYQNTLDVAKRLREQGYLVSVDVCCNNNETNLHNAIQQGMNFAAIVETDERNTHELVWYNLETNQEQRFSLDTLAFEE